MKLEGKVLGYDKKIVVGVAYTLILILVAFYAGAKYEKSKLTSLARQKTTNSASKQAGAKKNKTVVVPQETPDAQNTADANGAAPVVNPTTKPVVGTPAANVAK